MQGDLAPLIRQVSRLLPATQIRHFTTTRVGAARAWAVAHTPAPDRGMTQLVGTPASQHGRPSIVAFALWTPPTLADMDDLHDSIRPYESVSLLLHVDPYQTLPMAAFAAPLLSADRAPLQRVTQCAVIGPGGLRPVVESLDLLALADVRYHPRSRESQAWAWLTGEVAA